MLRANEIVLRLEVLIAHGTSRTNLLEMLLQATLAKYMATRQLNRLLLFSILPILRYITLQANRALSLIFN